MKTETSPEQAGIAFLCDFKGVVLKYLLDFAGLSNLLKPGRPFIMGFETDSVTKALHFFSEIKNVGKAANWELCLVLGADDCRIFQFFGYRTDDRILILAAESLNDIPRLCLRLLHDDLERPVVIQLMMDMQMPERLHQNESERIYFEEMTGLYHEIETAQRMLTKKNLEFEKANNLLEKQREELLTLNETLNETIDTLEQTRDKLVQNEKMASLGRMVSGFAHEINTPIGIAVTAASGLEDTRASIVRMLASEEVHENELVLHLETIRDLATLLTANLRRAAELVTSFKRTSIDQTTETERLFSLSEVFQDVVLSLNNRFKQTPIEILTECPSDLNVYGYPGVIGQILTNFLMNSYLYAFNDGRDPGSIRITAASEKEDIHIVYSDNGKGMDRQTLQNLFEPFFTSRRGRGGTGLGMYICYNLVTARLGGTIECDSEPGKGLRCHIRFPYRRLPSGASDYETDS